MFTLNALANEASLAFAVAIGFAVKLTLTVLVDLQSNLLMSDRRKLWSAPRTLLLYHDLFVLAINGLLV